MGHNLFSVLGFFLLNLLLCCGHAQANRPKAKLSVEYTASPPGGNVTLTCSVNPPASGWTYFWYRGWKNSEPLTEQDAVFISSDKILVSPGGLYWCRGGRGNPVYYTEYSHSVVTNRAVVILRPDWPVIYKGDTITLVCEIEDGGDTEWEYEWTLPGSYTPPKRKEYKITSASSSHTGNYSCHGKMKNGQSTRWSEAFRLKVSNNVPHPVLTVSPLWLSPGDSVTLNCEIEHPSSGWRFYFHKAVPNLAQNYYSFKSLLGSSDGTEQDSYIVHGQNQTAAYLCGAKRGIAPFFVTYSGLEFVWSGDFHSAASLTVSPDRVQHFIQDSVLLSCKGNSTNWRVRGFSKSGQKESWFNRGTMTGSTWNIQSSQSIDGVFWCESETGQFSNAVNITKTLSDPKNFPFPAVWIVGPVCGAFFIIFLLLFLCYYTKLKDSCLIRSQSTNHGSATDHMINQDETQSKNSASPLQDEFKDVTYTSIAFKDMTRKDGDTGTLKSVPLM